MTRKCVALGEIMLRLKSPRYERLFQSDRLEATFGGGEANVLASLSQFGWETEFITGVPDHEIGDAALSELRKFGVGTKHCVRKSGRLGSYFLEAGAAQRPPKVVYDREGSVFSKLLPADIDFKAALNGADILLISGITPALSASAADLAVAAAEAAHALGVKIVCDFNYRSKLWNYGVSPHAIMPKLIQFADVVVAGIEDFQIMLGMELVEDGGGTRVERYQTWTQAVFEQYPTLSYLACSLRESVNASENRLSACLTTRADLYQAPTYDITHIVDRVGTGDAMVAGLIYGLFEIDNPQKAIDFATAAGCLKHSVLGDMNRVSVGEVEALIAGGGTGRVVR